MSSFVVPPTNWLESFSLFFVFESVIDRLEFTPVYQSKSEDSVSESVKSPSILSRKVSQINETLWKPSGDIELIDMGSNCFCLRMEDKEAMTHALRLGPWVINNHYLIYS